MATSADPATPEYSDTHEWITAYLTIHSLSVPSRRYSVILWLVVLAVFLAFSILHLSGSRGGFVGAHWSKWSLRRRTWRKKHALARAASKDLSSRPPLILLPSNAQLLTSYALALLSLLLAFLGPDYLNPSSAFLSYRPQYTISKSFWSSSARTGQIAFALLPLCVLVALKAPPFALLAIPQMVQLYFDKLAFLHRWAGRLVWFFAFLHVILWSIQLAKDVNTSTGRVAYVYAWSYTPFIFGWVAFTLLSLIILLSLRPIRTHFYEHFYILHILLVPSMLVMASLHHPSVAWWCWAALIIWMGERLWRGTWWIYANGIMGRAASKPVPLNPSQDNWEMRHFRHPSNESYASSYHTDGPPSPLDAYYHHDKDSISADPETPNVPPSISAPRSQHTYIPPLGYVHAELLSGRTVRLRLITPGFLSWSPGQHFLINIPSVSRFTSHPFTCATVCDEAAPTDAGRIMLFLIRSKGGWTRDLWSVVSRLTTEQSRGDVPLSFASENLPKNGVLLRAYVDGPFGSVARARWENHSTAVIICGGSGVSFGSSLLQYMCMCLSGRDGKHLGARPNPWRRENVPVLKRVRFIWLVREYSHIQWCASIIRHCMSIVPLSTLQVDIYVTNFKPVHLETVPATHTDREYAESDDELQPPHPTFVHEHSRHARSSSRESLESQESCASDVDVTYYFGENKDNQPPVDDLRTAHEEHMLDLTNFHGDVDIALPGETRLSRKLKKEGKLRRLNSRKLSAMGKLNRVTHMSQSLVDEDVQTSRHTCDHSADTYTSQASRALRSRKVMITKMNSTERLLPIASLSERPHSTSSEIALYSSLPRSESPPHPYLPPSSTPFPTDIPQSTSLVHDHEDPRPSTSTRPFSAMDDIRNDSRLSLAVLQDPSEQLPFKMDEREARDVNVVAEHARPGKPKFDKVITDEVEASEGAVVVAFCGPNSLDAMVRKVVAAKIDPARIRKGDMRGSITLISEQFEY